MQASSDALDGLPGPDWGGGAEAKFNHSFQKNVSSDQQIFANQQKSTKRHPDQHLT